MLETSIERVKADAHLGRKLSELKALREQGWQVTALIAPDQKTVVLLACRETSS